MTPIQLYEEIKPVLMMFQLVGMSISIPYVGDPYKSGENGVCFRATNTKNSTMYCLLMIDAEGITIDIINRFRCSFSDVPRFLAEELRTFHDS